MPMPTNYIDKSPINLYRREVTLKISLIGGGIMSFEEIIELLRLFFDGVMLVLAFLTYIGTKK